MENIQYVSYLFVGNYTHFKKSLLVFWAVDIVTSKLFPKSWKVQGKNIFRLQQIQYK